eukprot:5660527-Alexandrium_andersonii.AAC.1
MGAVLALDKSACLASSPVLRRRLKKHRWVGGVCIPVKLSIRDLGTHASTGRVMVGTTLSNRMVKALGPAKALARMPLPVRQKMNAMKQKVFAGAFYGAAAAPVRKQFKRALVTVVADCVVSSKSSN